MRILSEAFRAFGRGRASSKQRRGESRLNGARRLRVESLEGRRLLSISGPGGGDVLEEPLDPKAWTFMVYMDGDNDLEGAAIEDFLELASAGSDANVNLVVQFDRIAGWDSGYGDWTNTRRGLIAAGDEPDGSWGAPIGEPGMDEANMGSASTVVDFVGWATTNYPAANYALVLWDHGGGTKYGACVDETDGYDYLEIDEVGAALASIVERMDLFGFDCCQMGMLEYAHEAAGEASVFIGSEETEPWSGWAYDAFLPHLKANPTWTAAELGEDIVLEYGISYGGSETLSTVDLGVVAASAPDGLSATVSDLAAMMVLEATAADYGRLQTHRDGAAWFTDSDYRDLGTFLTSVAGDASLTSSISTTAATALAAYDAAVLANHSGPTEGGTGLSIYFQEPGVSPDPNYNAALLSFAAETQWDEFLEWWSAPTWSGPDLTGTAFEVDPGSLNGAATTAVTFEVTNLGTISADAGAFDVAFFFSDDPVFGNEDDIPANLDSADPNYDPANPNVYHVVGLEGDSSLTDTISVAVLGSDPFETDGHYYLGMRIDAGDAIAEYNEENNDSQGVGLDAGSVNWLDPFYTADMETDPGWTAEEPWAFGQPMGLGGVSYGNPDPASGYTGTNVYGVNLEGDYSTEVGGPFYLTTTPIDCREYEFVTLEFRRWLNTDYPPYVHATVDVSNDGLAWTSVYANPTTEVADDGWRDMLYDISSVADGESTVYVRWGHNVAVEGAFGYSGWNLDDVTLLGNYTGPDAEGPRVVGQTPAVLATVGQSTLEFYFSETMDTSSFDVAEDVVSFDGPSGDLTSQITGFAWIDNRTLEVQFTPRTELGQYTMVIGPAITDDALNLNAMDQNDNGANGETPGDRYTAIFEITQTVTVNFTNPGAIDILENGAANPYPSTIVVSGLGGVVVDVNVTLDGFSHTYPDDVDILLVSPTGQGVLLMSDVGNGNDVSGAVLTLDDEAAESLPDSGPLASGTYRPTNFETDDTFATPAPSGPYGETLANFDGIDPNGAWSLYVYDDMASDWGSIANGWSLTITTTSGELPNDFGDAPGPGYPTLEDSDGARHAATGPMLGATRDTESDGQPNVTADGDDVAGSMDDEDGVAFTSPLVGGNNASVSVTASAAGFLSAWIDFNADGDWADAGEQVFTDEPLVEGVNTLEIAVPQTPEGATYARFRLSTATGLSFTGPAPDGEVEDYAFGVISGSKWNDLNGDGDRNLDEQGLAGWTIYVDLDSDGTLDAGEPFDVTDESGYYSIGGLPLGTYIVAEVQQSGWTQTYPNVDQGAAGLPAWMEAVGGETTGTAENTTNEGDVSASDDADGGVIVVDPPYDPERFLGEGEKAADSRLAPYPREETFLLHSNPGASKVIYLDFDGHTTTGTLWNNIYGDPIVTPAYTLDGDSAFSDAELEQIQKVWERVSEDYLPFEVDVTTEDPGVEALRNTGGGDTQWGIRVVIGADTWYGSAGGVAYVGSFDWNSDTPCFVFNAGLTGVAEAASHEAGHTLGLYHDGTSSVEYYEGHGADATSWAPIMGVGYYVQLVQWSKGEYPDANRQEDDLQIIATGNGFDYRADDHGNSPATADACVTGTTTISAEGIIERNTDVDYFTFRTGAGTVTIDVDPYYRSPNLDILATLYDASGVVATSNPVDALNASFSLTLDAGTYWLAIDGVGREAVEGDPGYGDYGSLGYYRISGTIVDPAPPGTHMVVLGAELLVSGVDFGNWIAPGDDFGDAPDPAYPTTLISDGARHTAVGPTLGASRDTEPDGQPSAVADGDDLDATSDDEDGVAFTVSTLWASAQSSNPTATVQVDLEGADATANRLDAWIDFNRNGSWDDPGERIFSSHELGTTNGVQTLTFTIPRDLGENVMVGDTFARFRLSTAGGLAPTGAADDGEVEDYQVTLVARTLTPGDANFDGTVNQSDTVILAAHWGAASGAVWGDGDFNGDGRVNALDASILAANW
ncbi:MAG TPA: clostripain-related cysteine peptidase, partial [Thermoguttaceae bacterium]|nr:clostripain-related cysteine peptidase [Thermoguttaceae bacterium]